MLNVLCIILGVIFCLMTIIRIIYNISNEVYITIGAILSLSSILSCIDILNPTAMDVYRGKTTLEITYKDGVAIDTTVVFKNKR